MENNSNINIVSRLLELSKNKLDYSVLPKPYKEEHIFLANILNHALVNLEREFNDKFKIAVMSYKETLSGKGRFKKSKHGYFYNHENLLYINMQINQLKYAIYGDRFVHELKWNEHLGQKAYKDLIEQIDRTVLMEPDELRKHNKNVNKIANEILQEILNEKKNVNLGKQKITH